MKNEKLLKRIYGSSWALYLEFKARIVGKEHFEDYVDFRNRISALSWYLENGVIPFSNSFSLTTDKEALW